jgi:hypothetical protein
VGYSTSRARLGRSLRVLGRGAARLHLRLDTRTGDVTNVTSYCYGLQLRVLDEPQPRARAPPLPPATPLPRRGFRALGRDRAPRVHDADGTPDARTWLRAPSLQP